MKQFFKGIGNTIASIFKGLFSIDEMRVSAICMGLFVLLYFAYKGIEITSNTANVLIFTIGSIAGTNVLPILNEIVTNIKNKTTS